MQLTVHATRRTHGGASRLVQQSKYVCLVAVKTRRVPSRHCRDTRGLPHTTTVCITFHTPLGRFSMLDISTVGIVSVPKKVGVGNVSPRAFRRRIVRYWHTLGCRAIELGKYTVVYGVARCTLFEKGRVARNINGMYYYCK